MHHVITHAGLKRVTILSSFVEKQHVPLYSRHNRGWHTVGNTGQAIDLALRDGACGVQCELTESPLKLMQTSTLPSSTLLWAAFGPQLLTVTWYGSEPNPIFVPYTPGPKCARSSEKQKPVPTISGSIDLKLS
jgi:hypothetical protein